MLVIFNILLIRSIKKELSQREKIEELNKELEKAYAIEKKANELRVMTGNFLVSETESSARRDIDNKAAELYIT